MSLITASNIGNGFGPAIFLMFEPSAFIIINDGVSVKPNELANEMSLSTKLSYFLPSKQLLKWIMSIPCSCVTNFRRFSTLAHPESIGPWFLYRVL